VKSSQVADLICAKARYTHEADAIAKKHGYERVSDREWKSQEQIRAEQEKIRVGNILTAAMETILQRIPGIPGPKLDASVSDFSNAAFWHAAKIIEAAKYPLDKVELGKKLKRAEASARCKLAHSLKAARRKERELLASIEGIEQRLVIIKAWELLRYGYPEPPPPTLAPSSDGAGIPCTSGIYFFWRHKSVRYVGQSIRLNQRARLSHEHLKEKDLLSWVEVPIPSLDFAEGFYIGILRPERNFGERAKWRKEATA
jgi:hypothetical protein